MKDNLILFDNDTRTRLLPLTYLRPMCELRIGILSIREKWEKHLDSTASFITQEYLSDEYPIAVGEVNLLVNGSALPSRELLKLIHETDVNTALLKDGELIAARVDKMMFDALMDGGETDDLSVIDLQHTPFIKVNHLWDLFSLNDLALEEDYAFLTAGRTSQPIPETNTVIGDRIFLEPGASVEASTMNATTGPIYIGKNATIMEGCMIRGGLAMCENSVLKMGAKIYGATTVGPVCKVGGEVNNVVFQAYSNKGHDGFVGNSVIGQWCNLGADTNTSNLKNNYEEVKLWSYEHNRFVKTGLQFCGLIMGDHSKCGINTMFNTGTVIGVSCNIYGGGFPRNFIPSFSWGGPDKGFKTYQLDKAVETAARVMERRGIDLRPEDRLILLRVFEEGKTFRTWEKQEA